MKLRIIFLYIILVGPGLSFQTGSSPAGRKYAKKAAQVLRKHVLEEAAWAMQQQPVTVTANTSPRSAGSKHDFFSEGDYWWPDPANPKGPYIQKDGLTNPDNFVSHRLAMIRFSKIIGALASAYQVTGDDKYVRHAFIHLKAWFIDPETMMNPNLLYAQAIQGRFTGRGIGIIDTIQLMEVARGILVMQRSNAADPADVTRLKRWFSDYLTWLTTHPYGKDEMNAENNHGTCWVMQVASFARLTENNTLLDFCRDRYKTVLLPNQMAVNGSFPREIKRTKPYGYSLFNLDAMTMVCLILSDEQHDLWSFQLADGRSIKKGINFLYPYIADRSAWPFPRDVMYWENWPVAHPSLIFGAYQYNYADWYATWKKLDHNPQVEEVVRNLPVRHPIIWFN